MNATIHGIIDHMFRDVADNAETRALHEELLNNCLEHYDDLIQRGMSETEAIDAVVDSLKGMKEVIDEYPKKAGMEVKEKEPDIPVIEADAPRQEPPAEEKPKEFICSPEEIRILRTDLKACDLVVGVSSDRSIHVRCEDMEQILCEKSGNALWIKALDKTKKTIAEAGKKMSNEEFSLKGLLNFIGKAIESAASNISVSWNVYIDLPAGLQLAEMELNSKSGDVELHSTLPERLSIHCMSGDVTVEAADGTSAVRAALSTMSGDIEMNGNAGTLIMSSMSGDVTANGCYQTAELKSTSGEADLNGSAGQIRMHSVSGDVTAELQNSDVTRIEGRSTSGDVTIRLAAGTDSVHTAMSSVSGSTACRFADSGAGARLQITASSVSGDVSIR
ncbi:MAG: DUF4097 family beta strand repeat protein [Clostridia bacterium]|nr:DUF4097 family beta strand repeat protein [Clostridia bacterium]